MIDNILKKFSFIMIIFFSVRVGGRIDLLFDIISLILFIIVFVINDANVEKVIHLKYLKKYCEYLGLIHKHQEGK